MESRQEYELTAFVEEACELLEIPVRRPSPSVLELLIPPHLRRNFGNLESVRVTASVDLRRMEPELDLLAPHGFVIQSLTEILRGESAPLGRMVSGLPVDLDAEAVARSFHERFSSPPRVRVHRNGRLPPRVLLLRVVETPTFRRLLRVLFEARCAGDHPIHEVFPVLVCLESQRALDSTRLRTKPLYEVRELGSLSKTLPDLPKPARLRRGLELARRVAEEVGEKLASLVRAGTENRIHQDLEDLENYYRQQIAENPVQEQDLAQEFEGKRGALDAKIQDLRPKLNTVLGTIVYEIAPRFDAVLRDRCGVAHYVSVPLIPGRSEIPDDAIACGHVDAPLLVVPGEGIYCTDCATECRSCACGVRTAPSACPVCASEGSFSCSACVTELADGTTACRHHSYACRYGERHLLGDEVTCVHCSRSICPNPEHRLTCVVGGENLCRNCNDGDFLECSECSEFACDQHRTKAAIGAPVCTNCLRTCATDGTTHGRSRGAICRACATAGEERWFCEDHLVAVACDHERACSEHVRTSDRDGTQACSDCTVACVVCGMTLTREQTAPCRTCGRPVCSETSKHGCVECDAMACTDHGARCDSSGEWTCRRHLQSCQKCERTCRTKLLNRCVSCEALSCPDCHVTAANGESVCRDCVGSCSAEGDLWPKTALAPCVDHDSEDRFCPEHSHVAACCGNRLCGEHAVASAATGKLICETCSRSCALCDGRIGLSDGVTCSECDRRFCDTVEAAPRCVEGEVVCVEHMSPCVDTGTLVCAKHAAHCRSCDAVLAPATSSGCGICDAPMCSQHLVSCASCGQQCCDEHRATTDAGKTVCTACVRTCRTDGLLFGAPDGAECLSCLAEDANSWYCSEHLESVACEHQRCCRSHVRVSDRDDVHICAECLVHCGQCDRDIALEQSELCGHATCSRRVCAQSDHRCVDCATAVCGEHGAQCVRSGSWTCDIHLWACATCGEKCRTSLLAPCSDCDAKLCPECSVESSNGALLCSSCVAACEEDGAPWSRALVFPCADHESEALFCAEHLVTTACCGARVCRSHTLGSALSGQPVCERCKVSCKQCARPMLPQEGQRCARCQEFHCERCAPASRCAEGEVCCKDHMSRCKDSGVFVCETHRLECRECGGTLLRSASSCAHCEAALCGRHTATCTRCGKACCPAHRGRTSDSRIVCSACSVSCQGCPPTIWTPVDEAVRCAECDVALCPDHRRVCRLDQRPLCGTHAKSSLLHHGEFCAEHFGRCSSCGIRGLLSHGFCDLCLVFLQNTELEFDLPFHASKSRPAIRRISGWFPGRSRVRWRIGEKYVLAWVQTSVLREDRFVTFDRTGREVSVCTPRPPKGLRG